MQREVYLVHADGTREPLWGSRKPASRAARKRPTANVPPTQRERQSTGETAPQVRLALTPADALLAPAVAEQRQKNVDAVFQAPDMSWFPDDKPKGIKKRVPTGAGRPPDPAPLVWPEVAQPREGRGLHP